MIRSNRLLVASTVAIPLGLAAWAAESADITQVLQDRTEYSTFYHVLNQTGLTDRLKNEEGPFTIFAPDNEAFAQLPQPVLDKLMQADNKGDLETLIEYHVIADKEIKAEQALGATTTMKTMADDDLEVDGTGQVVTLIPTGMTIVQTAQGPIVRQRAMAVAAPAIEVGDPSAVQTASEQQGQARQNRGQQAQAQQQARQGSQQDRREGMQAQGQQAQGQQARGQQQGGAGQDVDSDSLSQMATAAGGQGSLGDAIVVNPDIQADNGIIHGINSVLIPQQVANNLDMQGLIRSQQQRMQDKQGQKEKRGAQDTSSGAGQSGSQSGAQQ